MASRAGRGRRAVRAGAVVGSALLGLAGALGCAASGGWRGDRFVHADSGASLGDLAAIEPGWERDRVPGATVAFRHADGTRASWVRDCRAVEANPKALGRALWVALPGAAIEEDAALEVAGREAWRHRGRAQVGASEQRVATIARVAPRCEDYFMLVVPHGELHHRNGFEAWVQGLRDEGPER